MFRSHKYRRWSSSTTTKVYGKFVCPLLDLYVCVVCNVHSMRVHASHIRCQPTISPKKDNARAHIDAAHIAYRTFASSIQQATRCVIQIHFVVHRIYDSSVCCTHSVARMKDQQHTPTLNIYTREWKKKPHVLIKRRARVYALYVYAAIIILVVVPQFFFFFSFGANKRMAECLCVGCSRFSRLASQQFSVLFQRVSKRWKSTRRRHSRRWHEMGLSRWHVRSVWIAIVCIHHCFCHWYYGP